MYAQNGTATQNAVYGYYRMAVPLFWADNAHFHWRIYSKTADYLGFAESNGKHSPNP